VQYYDERGILIPEALSEGGRRLYGEKDVRRLETICFLREMGVSISSISEILTEGDSGEALSMLLDRQRREITSELEGCKERLRRIEATQRDLRLRESPSLDAIGDVALALKGQKKLRHLRAVTLLTGLPLNLLQCTSIVLWIALGLWWPFALWSALSLIYGIWFTGYYFTRVVYICPECHTVFKPRLGEALFAKHTPTLRRLTCTHCAKTSLCMEIYDERKSKNGKAS
jgi:DNA-binding transcriptional MerR regulator